MDDGDKFGLRVAVKIISRRLVKKVGESRDSGAPLCSRGISCHADPDGSTGAEWGGEFKAGDPVH